MDVFSEPKCTQFLFCKAEPILSSFLPYLLSYRRNFNYLLFAMRTAVTGGENDKTCPYHLLTGEIFLEG